MLTMSSEILPKRTSMMVSVRMRRMQVLRVKMRMIFFQKDSCTNQVRSWEHRDCFSVSSPSVMHTIIILLIMKSDNMKIPPLSQLLKQKHDYEVHKKKLHQIMSDRKGHLQQAGKDANPRKYYNNFERLYNNKSMEIAKANSQIVKKIAKAKPSLSFKSVLNERKTSESRASMSLNSRTRILELERQNYRMKARVKSMHSSLNKDSLMKDYQRSMQIKNRIMHFKTEPNNRVSLKVNRYLSASKVTTDKQKLSRENSLPKIKPKGRLEGMSAQKLTKEMISMKMQRVGTNIASYYRKEDIVRNKVVGNNKLFKMVRQQRSKAMSMLEDGKAKGAKQEEIGPAVFATEVSNPVL